MRKRSVQPDTVKRENPFFLRFAISTLILITVLTLSFLFGRKALTSLWAKPTLSKIYKEWGSHHFEAVYDLSNSLLLEQPFNSTALAYRGFASFYLAVAGTETTAMQVAIDDAINSLRLAREGAKGALSGQVSYILGKAYFFKDSFSAYHYYADLAVYYLNEALEKGVEAADIAEYLGLGYAQLGRTEESIAAFSEALIASGSDTLLLAIGEQYIKNGQSAYATQYLHRLLETSHDELMKGKARLLIASVFADEGNYPAALAEYDMILEKDANNADALYGIGVVYEKQGDLVKARSFWRKALKAQVTHQGALQKLGKN